MRRALMSTSAALLLSACSVHPLPEDVAPLNTYQIVQKIRCEVRDSLRGFLITAIEERHPAIAAGMVDGSIDFATFDRNRLEPAVEALLARYDDTVIAYEFTFGTSESNGTSGSLGLTGALALGTLNVAASGGVDRARSNNRNFRILDTFERLVRSLPDSICDGFAAGANHTYPITGTLGLDEFIGTFLRLERSANLTGDNNVPRLSETIAFNTLLDGKIGGSLKIEPVGTGVQLTSIGLDHRARRTDQHTLVMVLTLPPDPKDRNAGKSAAERGAIEELERQRLLEIDAKAGEVRDKLLEVVK